VVERSPLSRTRGSGADEGVRPAKQHSRNQIKGVSPDVGYLLFQDKFQRKGNAMNDFIAKYQEQLSGVLSGFDRLVFRGQLPLTHEPGMKGYLWAQDLGLKDFGDHAEAISQKVKQASLAVIEKASRPVKYLASGKDDKQKMALEIARADHLRQGPICAFTAVEFCSSYSVKGNHETHKIELQRRLRKCLCIYQYWLHPVFGFMSARLQTWFPFAITIYLNGREWLAQELERAGMGYRRHRNCFTWVEDFQRAQALMKEQLRTHWVESFTELRDLLHPMFSEICKQYPMNYYWTCPESEWAMDLIFRDANQLRRLYPQLVHLGMTSFSSPDVLRFMGKRVRPDGTTVGVHELPISSDLKVRPNGVRIKHRLGPNSIKLYDKAYDELGAVLRPEITISDTRLFRVFRRANDDEQAPLKWHKMRSGIADLERRAEICQQALDRYCSALAAVDDSTRLEELTAQIECRVRWKGASVRALHPFEAEDHALLQAVNRGEFAMHGLRNRDLQLLLYPAPPKTKAEQRRRSAVISRKLRMLRAHGLIRKLPNTHRYQVTDSGREILNALLLAHRVTVKQILAAA